MGRDDGGADPELVGKQRREQGARPAERHEHGCARVAALLDRDAADRVRHVRVGDPQHAAGDLGGAPEPDLRGELVERCVGPRAIEPHAARDVARGQHPERHRGVGHGRLAAALAVAGRSRQRARAAWADAQEAAGVDERDRAAAGSDRADVDPRRLQRQADHGALVEHRHLPVGDQAGVEAGTAHVGDDRHLEIERGCQGRRGRGACDGTGEDRLEGALAGLRERHRAAARARDQCVAREPDSLDAGLQPFQVRPHPMPDERIDERRHSALVLAVLARDPMRQGDAAVEALRPQDAGCLEFVRRVRVRVQERDRDGVDALCDTACRGGAHGTGIQGETDASVGEHALVDREPQPPRNERRRR